MDKKKTKKTKEEPKLISRLAGIQCNFCNSRKQVIVGINYYPKQVVIDIYCETCGSLSQFFVFAEEGKPEKDPRTIALDKIKKVKEEKKK